MINIKELLENHLNKIVIHCRLKSDVMTLLTWCENNGYSWKRGGKYYHKDYSGTWERFEQNTCYSINNMVMPNNTCYSINNRVMSNLDLTMCLEEAIALNLSIISFNLLSFPLTSPPNVVTIKPEIPMSNLLQNTIPFWIQFETKEELRFLLTWAGNKNYKWGSGRLFQGEQVDVQWEKTQRHPKRNVINFHIGAICDKHEIMFDFVDIVPFKSIYFDI